MAPVCAGVPILYGFGMDLWCQCVLECEFVDLFWSGFVAPVCAGVLFLC